MDNVTRLTGPEPDPYAEAWGKLIRTERMAGKWVPDAPKLDNGGNRQVDFAHYLGVSQATLSAWERGDFAPSMYHQRQLVRKLAVAPDTLWRLMHAGGDAA